jgi:signal peptidase II
MPRGIKSILCQGSLVLLILCIDQVSKTLANHSLVYAVPVKVFSILNWRLLYNTGAAFSFLNTGRAVFNIGFIVFALTACGFLIHWLIKLAPEQRLQRVSLLFILAGALGNLIDRVVHGHVIDFIEFHIKQYSWPVFNIADSVICVGAVLFLLSLYFEKNSE